MFIDSCFILDEVVENEVPQLLDIPNAGALNHMDGKSKLNLWFKTLKHEMHLFIFF